jgi:hypothetical protein
MAVVEGLKQNHPDAIWEFLPASYQQQLNDLAHQFAARMDGELWGKAVEVVRIFSRLLKDRKDFIVSARVRLDPDTDPKSAAAEMTAIAVLLDTLLASDLADLEKLKSVDGGKFLAGTGRRLLTQMRAMGHDPFADQLGIFTDMNVTLVSSDGDSALLTIEVPDATASERAFVRVEGKWIPDDLARNWHENMGQAAARLAVLSPDNLQAVKPKAMSVLTAVGDVLEKLLAAKTEKQFAAVMGETATMTAMQSLRSLISELVGSTPGEVPDAADSDSDEVLEQVTVVVKGELDAIAQDEIRDRLKEAVDEGRGGPQTEMTGDDETTVYRIGPVADVDAFAKRLGFLKVTRVDAKGRIIVAVPK